MKNFLQKAFSLRLYALATGTLLVTLLLVTTLSAYAANFSQITSQLDYGDRGYDVTNLQTFLKDNPAIYPEGLVTGYYGPLTQEAVKRFQSTYGISPVGRVGPVTMAKINSLIASGGWSIGNVIRTVWDAAWGNQSDISGPQFYSVNHSVTANSVSFNWTTNENATAKIFYYTSPITMNEGDIHSVGFGATNGWTATNDGVARTTQNVTINGLQPNTTYYYVVVATDSSGNVSVWNPNTTFKTNG